jgi:hypothetical protein
MDLTKVGNTHWSTNPNTPPKPDPTGAKHIKGFQKDIKTLQTSNAVHDMLDVKRSKNKRQFLTGSEF